MGSRRRARVPPLRLGTTRRGQDHYPGARSDLALLLIQTGRELEARRILEVGASRGEVDSLIVFGNLLADEGLAGNRASSRNSEQNDVVISFRSGRRS